MLGNWAERSNNKFNSGLIELTSTYFDDTVWTPELTGFGSIGANWRQARAGLELLPGGFDKAVCNNSCVVTGNQHTASIGRHYAI